MKKVFSPLFADFWRILSTISPRNRTKTYLLFLLMALQSALELFFILTLTYLGAALTSPTMLNENYIFKGLYFLSPQLKAWGQNPRYLLLIAGCIVVTASALKNIVSYIAGRTTIRLSERVSIDLGEEIMQRFLYSNYMWHLSAESSSAFQCMQWRSQLALMLISQLSMYACMLTVIILFFSLVGHEPALTTIVICFLSFSGFMLYRFLRQNVDKSALCMAESVQDETRAILCATRGIRDVLIYRQQEVFLQSVVRAAERGMSARVFNTIAPTIPTWVLESIAFGVVVIALFYLVFIEQADIPRITMALGLLLLTAWRVMPYANRVVSFQVTIRSVHPMAMAVLELLEKLRNEPRAALPTPDENFSFVRCLSLRNVCFRYPGAEKDSLKNLTLDIPVGKKVGIIGPSGGGKSTLVGMLSGLLEPTGGKIMVDGQPLTPSRAAAFAQFIGYVPQTPFLFAGTLAENIAFSQWGKPWDKERVRDACRKAAIDFVDNHPLGLEQSIGENGAGLSGGQAQRVSIARAMYTYPKLLIFDEATSALDQANEDSIQRTIQHLSDEVTCIIVAHRLTTVEHCDFIIWMDKGEIVLQGEFSYVLEQYRASQRHGSNAK